MMKCIFLRYKALFFYLFLYVGIAGDFYLQASSSTKEAKKAWWQRGWDYLKKNKKYVGYVGAAILSGGAAVHALNRFGGYGGMQVFGHEGEKSSSHNNNTRVPWSLWGGIKNTFAVASLTAAEEETLKKYYNGDEVDRISYYCRSIPKDARAFLRDHPAIMERFLTNVDRKNIDLLLKKDPRYEKIKKDHKKMNEIVFLLKQCFAYGRFREKVDLSHDKKHNELVCFYPPDYVDDVNYLRANIFLFLTAKSQLRYQLKNNSDLRIKDFIIYHFEKNKLSIEDFLREGFYEMVGIEHWSEERERIEAVLEGGYTIYEFFGNELTQNEEKILTQEYVNKKRSLSEIFNDYSLLRDRIVRRCAFYDKNFIQFAQKAIAEIDELIKKDQRYEELQYNPWELGKIREQHIAALYISHKYPTWNK